VLPQNLESVTLQKLVNAGVSMEWVNHVIKLTDRAALIGVNELIKALVLQAFSAELRLFEDGIEEVCVSLIVRIVKLVP